MQQHIGAYVHDVIAYIIIFSVFLFFITSTHRNYRKGLYDILQHLCVISTRQDLLIIMYKYCRYVSLTLILLVAYLSARYLSQEIRGTQLYKYNKQKNATKHKHVLILCVTTRCMLSLVFVRYVLSCMLCIPGKVVSPVNAHTDILTQPTFTLCINIHACMYNNFENTFLTFHQYVITLQDRSIAILTRQEESIHHFDLHIVTVNATARNLITLYYLLSYTCIIVKRYFFRCIVCSSANTVTFPVECLSPTRKKFTLFL